MSRRRSDLAVVTGATGGIGRPVVERLVEIGYRVIAVSRHAPDPAVPSANGEPDQAPRQRVIPCQADLCTPQGLREVVECAEAHGGAHLVVHAAGLGSFGLFAEQPAELAARLMQINALAPLELTRLLLPQLLRQHDATVVAVGSTFCNIGFAGHAAYCASKFALRGLFESLAREYADGSVRFCLLSPRATDTEFNDAATRTLNVALGNAVDDPRAVAEWLVSSALAGRTRRQFGWPEKLFARINGLWPELVDRALRSKLATIRRAASPSHTPSAQESPA
ncbi:MAG: SDR family oxidoreductase [Xanthomonadales bacterium]|nr:SDR family oxidoreductase [Xanthomonadales bacterium]